MRDSSGPASHVGRDADRLRPGVRRNLYLELDFNEFVARAVPTKTRACGLRPEFRKRGPGSPGQAEEGGTGNLLRDGSVMGHPLPQVV